MNRRTCGTPWGYRVHLKRRELACDACLAAHRVEWSRWRSRRGEVRELRPCGTRAAYKRHLRRGEPPCWPCRLANRRGQDLTDTSTADAPAEMTS